MAIEIERKFLVEGRDWRGDAPGIRLRQAYLAWGPPVTVRVRVVGSEGRLTLKTPISGLTRQEFEYAIPMEDAEELIARGALGHVIEKVRYDVMHEGARWEVDVFEGLNEGLVVAEIELESEDEAVAMPPWAGKEVSMDARYLNVNLARRPYSEW